MISSIRGYIFSLPHALPKPHFGLTTRTRDPLVSTPQTLPSPTPHKDVYGPLRLAFMAGVLGGLSGCSSGDSLWFREVMLPILASQAAQKNRQEKISPPAPLVKNQPGPPNPDEVPPSVMVVGKIGRMRGRILRYPQNHLPGTDPLAPTPVIKRFWDWNGVGRDDIFDMLYTQPDHLKEDPDLENGINPVWFQKLSGREIEDLINASTDGLKDINDPPRQTLSAHILLDLITNDRLLDWLKTLAWNHLWKALTTAGIPTRFFTFKALTRVTSRSRHPALTNFYYQIRMAYLKDPNDAIRESASAAGIIREAAEEAPSLVFQLHGTREAILEVEQKIEDLLPALKPAEREILKKMLRRKIELKPDRDIVASARRLLNKI